MNKNSKCVDEFLKEKARKLNTEAIKILGLAYLSKISLLKDLSFPDLLQKSFDLAKEAATILKTEFKNEPDRSVYYFIACVLAVNLDLHKEAKQLFNEMNKNDKEENTSVAEIKKMFIDDIKEIFEQNKIEYNSIQINKKESEADNYTKYKDLCERIHYWIDKCHPELNENFSKTKLSYIVSFISGMDAYAAAKILEKGGWKVNGDLLSILLL